MIPRNPFTLNASALNPTALFLEELVIYLKASLQSNPPDTQHPFRQVTLDPPDARHRPCPQLTINLLTITTVAQSDERFIATYTLQLAVHAEHHAPGNPHSLAALVAPVEQALAGMPQALQQVRASGFRMVDWTTRRKRPSQGSDLAHLEGTTVGHVVTGNIGNATPRNKRIRDQRIDMEIPAHVLDARR